MYDLEKVLQDEAIRHNNLILWLNSKQKMFPNHAQDADSEFVQRNYHYRGIFETPPQLHDIKEPNVYPINLTQASIRTSSTGCIRCARTERSSTLASTGPGACRCGYSSCCLCSVNHVLHFRRDLSRSAPQVDRYQFGMHQKNFNRGASILTGHGHDRRDCTTIPPSFPMWTLWRTGRISKRSPARPERQYGEEGLATHPPIR